MVGRHEQTRRLCGLSLHEHVFRSAPTPSKVDWVRSASRNRFLRFNEFVAKRKESVYRVTEKPSLHWIKIKNPAYSQAERRRNYSSGNKNEQFPRCL